MVMEIYTIGYGRRSFESVLSLLRKNSIETVVDVRSIPFSKANPEFCRTSLKGLFPSVGIRYLFISDARGENLLGGMPRDPSVHVDSGISYELLAEKEYYKEGIRKLLDIARERIVCLMCAEEDPKRCHRHHLIAKTLLSQGIKVIHITADNVLQEACIDKDQSSIKEFLK